MPITISNVIHVIRLGQLTIKYKFNKNQKYYETMQTGEIVDAMERYFMRIPYQAVLFDIMCFDYFKQHLDSFNG